MMRYRCRECDEPFDELVKCHGDRSMYHGVPESSTYYGCPHCKSEFFDDMEELERLEEEEDEPNEDPLEGTF